MRNWSWTMLMAAATACGQAGETDNGAGGASFGGANTAGTNSISGSAGTAQAGSDAAAGSAGSGLGRAGAASSGAGGIGGAAAGSGGSPQAGSGGSATGGGDSGAGAAGSASAGGSGGSVDVGEVPLDPALLGSCKGSSPITCTIPVPSNGNYTVTVELGSASVASTSRVQAEEYRISVPPLMLAAGTYSKQTFSVNVRDEMHDGYSMPGKVLDLLIDGAAPALHGLGYKFTPDIPTIFVAGDSTVCDWEPTYAATKAGPLERGWAQEVSQYLEPGIAVANYADSGETAASFYARFWGPAKALLREGDYVFIEFGHNDQNANGLTTAQFQTNMLKYVTDARNAKATPVLLTPVGRKSASAANHGFNGFDQATRDLAMREKVALVDLTVLSIDYYATLPDRSVMFATSSEGTHFSEYGAGQISRIVTTNLKTSALPLVSFLK